MIVTYVMESKMMLLKVFTQIRIAALNFLKKDNMDIYVNRANLDAKLNLDN